MNKWEKLLFIPRGGTIVDERRSIRKTRKIKHEEIHENLRILNEEIDILSIRNKIRDDIDSQLT